MKTMDKINSLISKYMAVLIIAAAALALFLPASGTWIDTGWINYLLMVVMLGMGLTLDIKDFALIFTRPKDILLGCAAQFTIMPLLAFGLSKAFSLDPALTAGVILVGTCPGGTASNVITYLSKGDVALSVGMTSVNTLLAPLLTPAITYLLLRTSVKVDVWGMFLSIIKVVIVPIAVGFILNRLLGKRAKQAAKALPAVSVTAITLIVMCVVSHNSEKILSTGALVFAVVILHNLLGYLCGFGLGKLLRLELKKVKALSVEIGMQNSGLASSLAVTAFPDLAMATVPGAIFSVWHNISGAILGSIFSRFGDSENEQTKPDKEEL